MSTATQQNTQQAAADPWTVKVGGGGQGGDYVLCPAGNYRGTIIGLYDIGTQHVNRPDGSARDLRRLVIVFELAKKRPDGQPFVLGERYTFSMNEKANLYGLVTNVLGAKLKDGDTFSVAGLLGQPVMVTVTHTSKGEGEGAKTYHNVGAVSPFPEDMADAVPKPTFLPARWSVAEGTPFPAGREYLPHIYGESIQALAEGSAEWRKRAGASSARAAVGADDPDIPF